MELQDLIGRGLEGGTLVEYKANCGFELEYGRSKIVAVGLEGDNFFIRTDNEEAFLEQNVSPEVKAMGYGANVQTRGPYVLISSPMGWCYIAAPPGIDVPQKPGWLDVSDEEFDQAIKRRYGASE